MTIKITLLSINWFSAPATFGKHITWGYGRTELEAITQLLNNQ